MTARAVAEWLGVSTETVLRWVRKGDLPAVRLPGGAIRIDAAELGGWLDARKTTGTANGEVACALCGGRS